MQSEPYRYYLLDHQKSDDKCLHYSAASDRRKVIESKVSDLIIIDLSLVNTRDEREVDRAVTEGVKTIFYERYGHTIISSEEEFDLLYRARVNIPYRYSSVTNMHDMAHIKSFDNLKEFVFRLQPELNVPLNRFNAEETLLQIVAYAKKYGHFTCGDLDGNNYDNAGIRRALYRHYGFFNQHGIFVHPRKMILEYNPRRAAKQHRTYQLGQNQIKERNENKVYRIHHYAVQAFYQDLCSMIEYALRGERIRPDRSRIDRYHMSVRIVALTEMIKAIYSGYPYRRLLSFESLKQDLKKLIAAKSKQLEDYDSDFIRFMENEIVNGPKKARRANMLFKNIYEMKLKEFLVKRFNKKFQYILNVKLHQKHNNQ